MISWALLIATTAATEREMAGPLQGGNGPLGVVGDPHRLTTGSRIGYAGESASVPSSRASRHPFLARDLSLSNRDWVGSLYPCQNATRCSFKASPPLQCSAPQRKRCFSPRKRYGETGESFADSGKKTSVRVFSQHKALDEPGGISFFG